MKTIPYSASLIRASQESFNPFMETSSLRIGHHGTPPRPTTKQLTATEEEIRSLWENGDLPFLTHLDGSEDGSLEEFLCEYFERSVNPMDWVCASHRCHFVYQLHGGTNIIDEVKAGRSMFLSGSRFISSAIVAGTASIAVGLGMAIKARNGEEMVHHFSGDGSADHGHLLEAIACVQAKQLPVHFVILDNNSSCGVTKEQRRGSNWEWEWPPCVAKFEYRPRWPHAGSGGRPNLKWKP